MVGLRIRILLVLAPLCLGTCAHASSECDRLAFELANIASRAQNSPEVARFDQQISELEDALTQLDNDTLDAGCNTQSVLVLGAEHDPQCNALDRKRNELSEQLVILSEARSAFIARQDVSAARHSLENALASAGCTAEGYSPFGPGDEADPLVHQTRPDRETYGSFSTSPFDNDMPLPGSNRIIGGLYRTMCVRTCDGGLFPISSQATPQDFQRDAQTCSMMCPNTKTELFYGDIEGETSDLLSAATGKAYTSLPNAFLFRTRLSQDRACGCDFAQYYRTMTKRQSLNVERDRGIEEERSIVRLPARATKAAERAPVPQPLESRDYVPDPHMRKVGPRFFPDDRGMVLNRKDSTLRNLD